MSSITEQIKEGLSALEKDLTAPPYIPREAILTEPELDFVRVLYAALTAGITADLLEGITAGRNKLAVADATDESLLTGAIQFFRSAAKDSDELYTSNYYYVQRRFNPEEAALEPEEDDSDYEEYKHYMGQPSPVPNILEILPEYAALGEDAARVAYGAYHTMLQEINSTAEGFAHHLQHLKASMH